MRHIPPTNLLLVAAKQVPYKKAYLLTKILEEFSGKSSGEWTSRQKKRRKKDKAERESNRTRQKNKRGDSKVESNDIRYPRPSLWGWWYENTQITNNCGRINNNNKTRDNYGYSQYNGRRNGLIHFMGGNNNTRVERSKGEDCINSCPGLRNQRSHRKRVSALFVKVPS